MPEQPKIERSSPEGGASTKKDNGLLLAVKYSHIGFALPAGTVVGWLIGAALDKWLGTHWIATTGLIVGVIAGFTEMIRAISQISKDSK